LSNRTWWGYSSFFVFTMIYLMMKNVTNASNRYPYTGECISWINTWLSVMI